MEGLEKRLAISALSYAIREKVLTRFLGVPLAHPDSILVLRCNTKTVGLAMEGREYHLTSSSQTKTTMNAQSAVQTGVCCVNVRSITQNHTITHSMPLRGDVYGEGEPWARS